MYLQICLLKFIYKQKSIAAVFSSSCRARRNLSPPISMFPVEVSIFATVYGDCIEWNCHKWKYCKWENCVLLNLTHTHTPSFAFFSFVHYFKICFEQYTMQSFHTNIGCLNWLLISYFQLNAETFLLHIIVAKAAYDRFDWWYTERPI